MIGTSFLFTNIISLCLTSMVNQVDPVGAWSWERGYSGLWSPQTYIMVSDNKTQNRHVKLMIQLKPETKCRTRLHYHLYIARGTDRPWKHKLVYTTNLTQTCTLLICGNNSGNATVRLPHKFHGVSVILHGCKQMHIYLTNKALLNRALFLRIRPLTQSQWAQLPDTDLSHWPHQS